MTQGMLKFWRRSAIAMICFGMTFLSMAIAPVLLGQSATTGALTGTVKDSSGAVVPNATVTVTSIGSGQARSTTTTANGTYSVGFLPPGNYQVKFEASGFSSVSVPSVTINVTETPTLDEALTVGAQSQQVEVRSESELVQTATSSVGTVVSSDTVTSTPLTTRNYTNLVGLSAGVQVGVFNAVTMGRGSQDISVNGAGPAQNNYQQDGASINSWGGTGSVADQGSNPGTAIVNPDAIAEFKIQTSMYDAGYGRNPGANVNVVTKSGTNQFHGTAFEFFRNTALNANDFFKKMAAPIGGVPQNERPVVSQNQFGGTIGGPIKKDKLFFFVSEQETRQINGAAPTGFSIPTLAGIPTGNRGTTTLAGQDDATAAAFRKALGQAFCPVANSFGCPATGASGGTGLTSLGKTSTQVAPDGSNISTVAMRILQLPYNGGYFVPSSPTGQNFQTSFSLPVHFTEHQILGNGDYVISSKSTVSAHYFYSRDPAAITMSCAGSGGAANTIGQPTACLPGAPGTTNFPASYTTVKLTTLLTNNLVNEARLSIQTVKLVPTQGLPYTDTQVGIAPIIPAENALDQITIRNPSMIFGGGNNLAKITTTSAWEAADQVSWSHGKHTVRAGFEFERDRWNQNQLGVSFGALTFQTFQDFLLGLPGCAPGAACTALGSGPGSVPTATSTNGSAASNINSSGGAGYAGPAGGSWHFQNSLVDAFVQDDFKILPNLTLNLGVRWEWDGWPKELQGKNTNTWVSQAATVNVPVSLGGTLGNSAATGTLAGWVVPANYQPALWTAPTVGGLIQSSYNSISQAPFDDFGPRVGFAWKPLSGDRFVVRGGIGMFYDRLSYAFFSRSTGAPPYNTTLGQSGNANFYSTFSQPYPAPPYTLGWPATAIRWVNPATGASANVNTPGPVGPVLQTPTTYQYNLTTQYEFKPSWVVELGYVGSHAVHLFPQSGFTERELNQAVLVPAGGTLNGQKTNSVANVSLRVPYLGYSAGGLFADETTLWSRYNSLQVTVRKQMSHGLQFQAAYSWSKSISSAAYLNYNDETITAQGLNPNIRPQRLAVNYTWTLPFGTHDGLLGKAVDGWSVAGVTIVQDGQALTPTDTRGGTAYGFGGSTRITSTPVYIPGVAIGNPGTDEQRLGLCANTNTCTGWFNRAAVLSAGPPAVPNATGSPTATGYGTPVYGNILGPGQFNFDVSIQKITTVGGLHENASLVFRTDFFNAFNHAQFANPTSVDASQTNFGAIANTNVNPRLIQFSLKYVF